MHRLNKSKDARRRARKLEQRATALRPSAANDMQVIPDKRRKLKRKAEHRDMRYESMQSSVSADN